MFGTRVVNCGFSIYAVSNYRHSSHLMKNLLSNVKFAIRKYPKICVAYTHDLAVEKPSVVKQSERPVNKFVLRTHTCGELTIQNVGDNVKLSGWMEYQRMGKFLTLRDAYGSTQFIVPEHRKDLQEAIDNLPYESVLCIAGTVVARPKGQENKRMKTGDIEVQIESLEVLNAAKQKLPILIREYKKVKEITQMKYRYLSLRYPELQRNLRLRSQIISRMREYLIKECDFVDIETPTLFKSTPGGAQEFIVPTQHPGQFYSLVQSPQQFKQLLMVGGFDRYFQVARCYRDEGARNDRQPEFTQLDIEMSFVDREGVMELIEGLFVYSWPEESGNITMPFKQLSYHQAMELYGTDQPDLRIPYQLQDVTNVVDHSVVEQCLNVKWGNNYGVYCLVFPNTHDALTSSVKKTMSEIQCNYYPKVRLVQMKISNKPIQSRLSSLYSEVMKENVRNVLKLSEGDVLFLTCGEKPFAQQLLGKLRLDFTNTAESRGTKIRTSDNEFLWITDFPLFTFDATKNKLEATHHPFTQPHPEDVQYISTDPTKVRGLHYDLVLNGSEIAGGSIRIHNAKLQKQILEILNIDDSYLEHMLDALASGAPPHGGIALGLDRLICLLCKGQSIRSVIAFPKTMEGRDMMSGAPVPISEENKKLYHIQTTDT